SGRFWRTRRRTGNNLGARGSKTSYGRSSRAASSCSTTEYVGLYPTTRRPMNPTDPSAQPGDGPDPNSPQQKPWQKQPPPQPGADAGGTAADAGGTEAADAGNTVGGIVEGAADVAGGAIEVGGAAIEAVGNVAGAAAEGAGGCAEGCGGCSAALLIALFLTASTAFAVFR